MHNCDLWNKCPTLVTMYITYVHGVANPKRSRWRPASVAVPSHRHPPPVNSAPLPASPTILPSLYTNKAGLPVSQVCLLSSICIATMSSKSLSTPGTCLAPWRNGPTRLKSIRAKLPFWQRVISRLRDALCHVPVPSSPPSSTTNVRFLCNTFRSRHIWNRGTVCDLHPEPSLFHPRCLGSFGWRSLKLWARNCRNAVDDEPHPCIRYSHLDHRASMHLGADELPRHHCPQPQLDE